MYFSSVRVTECVVRGTVSDTDFGKEVKMENRKGEGMYWGVGDVSWAANRFDILLAALLLLGAAF